MADYTEISIAILNVTISEPLVVIHTGHKDQQDAQFSQ